VRLDQLTQVEEAEVFSDRVRAGTLRRTGVDVEFQYAVGYGGPPIATTLPVRPEPFSTGRPGAVPPFFAGLLPEGRRLTALRRAVKTSADDDLSLLLAVGTDLVGHARVTPLGEPIEAATYAVTEALDELSFSELFGRVLARDPADRVGLPGVQDKISGRMISLPVRHRDARWILKLDPPEFPQLVENEAFFLDAAARSGLRVPYHEVVRDRDGAAGLLVQRFDRQERRRLALEDGCQVCARYPADKYRLSSEEVVAALSAVCGAPIVAARDLLRQFVFAYLTCNGDAHAKNFSILRQPSGEWAVSPVYDLPSSHPYGDTTMALTVNGKSREDIGREDFLALAASSRVRPRAAARVIDELLEATPTWLVRIDDLPFDGRRVHKLRRAIEYRERRLRG
jgi:serine/threonine-protein kinase HipA